MSTNSAFNFLSLLTLRRQSLQVPSLPLSTEALIAIGVTPNVKSRGYVAAVFQAYAKAQSILLDYSRVGEYKDHEGLMAGDDKSPRTSEKSPFSSFGEAVCSIFYEVYILLTSIYPPRNWLGLRTTILLTPP